MKQLVTDADRATAYNPKNPNILIWNGIIQATYAGIQGGLGALSSNDRAKTCSNKPLQLIPQH